MPLPENFYHTLFQKSEKTLTYDNNLDNNIDKWASQVRVKLYELLKLDELRAMVKTDQNNVPQVRIAGSEDCDDFIREKVYIKGPMDDIPAYILIPKQKRAAPAIICLHGHGGYSAGKTMVAGATEKGSIEEECAEALNYGYGVQMAKAGYVTICPDAFGFGERRFPEEIGSKAHLCSKYFISLVNYGLSPIAITTISNILCVDYILSRKEVKGDNVGCIGLSFGGSQAQPLACADLRVQASVFSGCLSSYAKTPGGRCGAPDIPFLLQWFDKIDMFKAYAPRPALYEIMSQDSSFNYETSLSIYDEIKAVYRRRNLVDNIDLDVADTDHRYIGNKSVAFFERNLPK
jgi:dienelactone hydrolase